MWHSTYTKPVIYRTAQFPILVSRIKPSVNLVYLV